MAELTIDFWAGLQDTPLHARHEQLRAPLFQQVATRLMARCKLPASFKSWAEEDELDFDEFERFREQSAQPVFASCLQLLHAEFLAMLAASLDTGAQSWQAYELALYITRCLHAEIKSVLSADADGGGLSAPLLDAHKQAVRALLTKLLAPAEGGGKAFEGLPAPLLTSAVRLYGSFGKWIAKEQPEKLEVCVQCVLKALVVEESGEHAAVAFRALCVHAQRQLGKAEMVHALLSFCDSPMRNETLTPGLRVALVEGLARLVASLPREEHAQQALSALILPPCQLLQQSLASLPPPTEPPTASPKEIVEAVATHLSLIASSIRFCDRFKPERHPVLPVLQGCWPLLMEVAGRHRGEPIVVQAMCDLYSVAMGTMGTLIRPLLPQLLSHLAGAFQSTPVTGCLTTLRDAVERFGKDSDPELSELLGHNMSVVIKHTCAFLRSSPDPEAQPELLSAFWEMCHRCLVFVPGLLLAPAGCAPELFEAGIACVRHQEFQHTRSAISFICLFMCPTEAANQFRETSAICLQTQGKQLLRECLSGLASASPDNLIDHQVEMMRVLIEACPSAVGTWLREILDAPQGVSFGVIDPQGEAMRTFAMLVLQQPALPQTEFQCVASDFSRICRGKLGPESLERYVLMRQAAAASVPAA